VYIDRTKETTDKTKNIGLSLDFRNSKTPRTMKKLATFASKAALESNICQGEIASTNAEISPRTGLLFLGNSSLTRK
jgi:hypothetical protein